MTTHDEAAQTAGLSHGQLCYLQMPALDIAQCAKFYSTIFGWKTEPASSGFEAPSLIGQWTSDRAPAPESGLLAWINVDHIDATLAQCTANGGRVLEPPTLDGGVRWLATILDPAGNAIGVVQLGAR